MRTAIFALAILVGACSSSESDDWSRRTPDGGACERTFVASADFTPEERASIERAASRWNAIATERFCVVDGEVNPDKPDKPAIIRIEVGSERWQRMTRDFGVVFLGFYLSFDLIVIVSGMPLKQFEQVALHEFGHAHGLEHVAPPAIMCPYVGTADDFEVNDIKECQRVGACPGGYRGE